MKEKVFNRVCFGLGVLSIIVGVTLVLYLAGYQMFIGGIFDLYNMITKDSMTINTLAIGVAKIVFASPVGGFIFWISYYTGMKLIFR